MNVNVLRQFHDGRTSRWATGGQEERQVSFNISLLRVTKRLHDQTEHSSGVAVDLGLDGNLFDVRRLHAPSGVCRGRLPELRDVATLA